MPLVLAPMGDGLGMAVTEGIEDALSVHQATGLGAWAAGGWPNLPGLVTAFGQLARRGGLPESITILVDGDDDGRAGSLALAAALAELSAGHSHHFEILLSEAFA
jgi:hypothetical protein